LGRTFGADLEEREKKDTRGSGGKINLNWAACYRSRRRPEACGRSLLPTSIAC